MPGPTERGELRLVAVQLLSMVSALFSRQVAGMLFCAGLVLS